MEFVTKTVKEVFEAIAKNGFEHLRGSWFEYMENEKAGACILGQGAINLGVFGYNMLADDEPYILDGEVLDVEDEAQVDGYTILSQLNQWEVPVESRWYRSSTPRLATAIMYWNDATVRDEYEHYDPDKFVLPTYYDVVNMAREILEPHFDEEVKLAVYDYQMPTVGAI